MANILCNVTLHHYIGVISLSRKLVARKYTTQFYRSSRRKYWLSQIPTFIGVACNQAKNNNSIAENADSHATAMNTHERSERFLYLETVQGTLPLIIDSVPAFFFFSSWKKWEKNATQLRSFVKISRKGKTEVVEDNATR